MSQHCLTKVNDIRNSVFGLAGAAVYDFCKSREQKFVMSFTITVTQETVYQIVEMLSTPSSQFSCFFDHYDRYLFGSSPLSTRSSTCASGSQAFFISSTVLFCAPSSISSVFGHRCIL